MSWSSLAVAVVGVVVGAGAALETIVVVGVVVGGGVAIISKSSRGSFGVSRSFDALTHLYSPYPYILLGAQLHRPFLNFTSMLYVTPSYVTVVFEVIWSLC